MVVELTKEWRGLPPRHVVDLPDGIANLLVERLKVANYTDAKNGRPTTKTKPNSRANNGTRKPRRSKRSVRDSGDGN